LHLGCTLPRDFLSRVVDQLNDLAPDAVVITGDLFEEPARRVAEQVAQLERLNAPLGTYFITGNHDYIAGIAECLTLLAQHGVKSLRNQRLTLHYRGEPFDLAGVDDSTGKLVAGHGPDFAAALANRDRSLPLLLLAHEPRSVRKAIEYAPDLQLSGHTHAGQIWPFGWLVRLVEPYVEGLHEHTAGQWIYVSRGTGYWGPPMRLPRRSEITLFTLRGEPDAGNA
jgi:predicted MPP superfamily phosphohydrolase